jgi:hypothetical protein
LEGIRKEFQKLDHTHVLVKPRHVWQITHHPAYRPRRLRDVVTRDARPAAVRTEQRGQDLDEGGFTGAVWPHQAKQFSRFHVQIEAREGPYPVITLT